LREFPVGPVKVTGMDEQDHLSAVIGTIYDAALTPTLWGPVLGECRKFIGGCGASLYFKNVVDKTGSIYYQDGSIDPHYVDLYFSLYAKLDPSTAGQFFAEVGKPMAAADLVPLEEFVETRFYKEWARPQGLIDSLGVVLEKSAISVAMFSVFRHERDGLADDEMRRRMRLLAPHVQRAALIGRVIDLKSADAASFADTLDGLSAATFLLDLNGRLVHANASGHALLQDGGMLRAMGSRLMVQDAATQRALAEVVALAGGGDAALGTDGIAMPLMAPDGVRHVVHVLPLTSGARRLAGAAYTAVVALFVNRASLDSFSPPAAIAKFYKLTPTELRVMVSCVEVGSVPQAAAALGIAETTVKTHLHRVFSKTGTNRQSGLVKLMAEFASPLMGVAAPAAGSLQDTAPVRASVMR
jgi:DNA-binding CsgD family transcriptional regulator